MILTTSEFVSIPTKYARRHTNTHTHVHFFIPGLEL